MLFKTGLPFFCPEFGFVCNFSFSSNKKRMLTRGCKCFVGSFKVAIVFTKAQDHAFLHLVSRHCFFSVVGSK